MSLLDAGCGAGLALRLAAEQGARVSGLDASAALLDVARGRLPDADLRVGDIEELPYDDASFDVVTAYNSIQYASDPKTAVAELARVARPGGRVVVEVWGEAPRRIQHHHRTRINETVHREGNKATRLARLNVYPDQSARVLERHNRSDHCYAQHGNRRRPPGMPTGRVHRTSPLTSENSAISRDGFFGAVGPTS